MTRSAWHIERTGSGVGACTTLARHMPARFDVSAAAQFPLLSPTRLAHQIRQDMWRALQNLRGFSPVVRIERGADALTVTAGGRVNGAVPSGVAARIEALLANPELRARWIAHSPRRACT